jgi:membrane-associated protease RseP (regulator of RpoE activity)
VHEFGHYFAARAHNVKSTLPYYIPFPVPILLNFGTFGAIIRIKQQIPNRKALFDIGLAGPLPGFFASLIFLIIGFILLPTKEQILQLHPEYITQFGGNIPDTGLHFGNTLLYSILSDLIIPNGKFIPPMNEIYHFPFLNVGWFGLFVTTMNLLPIGQFDGGHILYAVLGKEKHLKIARITMWVLIIIGAIGSVNEVYMFLNEDYNSEILLKIQQILSPPIEKLYSKFPLLQEFWSGWLLWGIIAKFLVKLKHPPVADEQPLDNKRKWLGLIALFMLISSFSFNALFFK